MSEANTPDTMQALMADMAADPAALPAIEKRINDQAQEFLDLSKSYAWKWMRLEEPWEAVIALGEAILWLQEAHKRIDKELSNQMRRDERYKRGGVLIEP